MYAPVGEVKDEELPEVVVTASPWPYILLTAGAVATVLWALFREEKRS